MKLPSFPRKALEADLSLYSNGSMGRVSVLTNSFIHSFVVFSLKTLACSLSLTMAFVILLTYAGIGGVGFYPQTQLGEARATYV